MVGLLIVRRQPRNAVGWLLLGVGLVAGLVASRTTTPASGCVVAPGSVPGPTVAEALNEGSWAPIIGLMGTFLILLFPTGTCRRRGGGRSPGCRRSTIVAVTVIIALMPGT